jgi:DHA1 family bicyclomycin/chloramphenicol resistance-like MFS transporter
MHYLAQIGETHPAERRTPLAASSVASAYGRLALDARFLLPALAVSLVIGGLYTFFAAAPAILMSELGLSPVELGLSFASTVLIVFAAGILAPRLAQRIGPHSVGTIGLVIALAGSLCMFAFAATPTYARFTLAIALFLFGMGLVNPLGTAIALHPFGRQAGLASSLLGFLQMGCAAIGASLASVLPLRPFTSLAVILTSASVLALLAFVPVALRQPRADLANTGATEPAGG